MLVFANGWYFLDEARERHGPYRTRREAQEALRSYAESFDPQTCEDPSDYGLDY